jgi:hypothetical protein
MVDKINLNRNFALILNFEEDMNGLIIVRHPNNSMV